jgi:hypothetical protein
VKILQLLLLLATDIAVMSFSSELLRRFIYVLTVATFLQLSVGQDAEQGIDAVNLDGNFMDELDDDIQSKSTSRQHQQQQLHHGVDLDFDPAAAKDTVDANKRPFDRIEGVSSLGGLSKKAFDRIDGYSSLGGFQRRAFDRIGGMSSLGDLQKRPFDRIAGVSALGGLGRKRAFDRIGGMSSLGDLQKRRFDSIAGMSSLGGLGKKSVDDVTP